ncbi:MAG TPA: HtaA domain-containing protein [Acidimicrobiia bacterium]|nr:HtaA domain-containing protein [Acidimicrobiia bacterium]
MATKAAGTPGRAVAVLVAGVLALGSVLFVGGSAAEAAATKSSTTKVEDATLAWTVSQYVMGANPAVPSLSEVRRAEAPATFVAATGWQFTDGTGTYDTKTGAMTLSFPGALEFGNVNTGNYAFKYANPTLTLDATGAGTLSADVSLRPVGASAFDAPARIVVVDVTGASPTTTKAKKKTEKHVEVTVDPTAFSDQMVTAAAELGAFFKATGSQNDGLKPPDPLTAAFDYKVKKAKS